MSSTNPATVVSSSSTLWATASKEWVIQPKPKPGRKPKKDPVPTIKPEEELDNKGRRVQNRAAQRAFRERKQSQLTELQARLQSYEQGEIERSVALQNIAKRLKEENEILRLENSILMEKLGRMEQGHHISTEGNKKRWRDDSPSSTTSIPPQTSKRSKFKPDSPRTGAPPLITPYTPSSPPMASSPGSIGTSDTRFSPLPFDPQSDPPTRAALSNILDFSSNVKAGHLEPGSPFTQFDCGFCNEDTPCVCRELAAQQTTERTSIPELKAASYTQTNPLVQVIQSISLEPLHSSILENLPAYQPPVPLRRRPAASAVNTIFPISSLPDPQSHPPPICSGDPSNCLACADDSFGKAFCSAIEMIATQSPCDDCPCICIQDATLGHDDFKTRDPCGKYLNCDSQSPTTIHAGPSPIGTKTMPTNDAWRQLKSHPNVAFADLSLLADVVARSSRCTGPRVVISPRPDSLTLERTISSGPSTPDPDHGPVLLTDPHARYREKERARSNGPSSPPQLVPQDVLIKCGRRRVREVQTDAVRAALRILDTKFS